MSFKVVAGEVSVAFHDVDDDRPPGFDVAGLGFVEEDERTDDVSAEAGRKKNFSKCYFTREKIVTYGISAASVSARLLLRSSPSSWYIRSKILT